ncbi:response regulator transcription factor [Ponticaulis sp.]|uniref:response regulator transcription factor n=1 Tax=Ponticaulis sp. TaxID=2020902 RepID=UPI000B67DCDB|nr:response regulator transcription factor [Ponticaulis sp.]MAI90909.1 DNA-binding response regulator [Ponticaulis sp.]OUX98253.1 MAG: DNA-binding response regulator [Hyphomonadaceae bacterium TMED5]|tara:strand:+ start:13821 stop:14456 length:636 start_codon:yes stop_codon:yes gene_type:complete
MKKALIVEDVTETRQWLCEVTLNCFPGCEIFEAKNVREALFSVKGHEFDLALVDLGLPDGSGTKVVEALAAAKNDVTIVVATVMGDDASVVAALSSGANGYLLKDSPPDVFERQLKQIEQGIPALSPSIARRILEHFKSTVEPEEPAANLTPRETEVLGLIGRGLRNSDAARVLGLTESTVASHIKSIYMKLGISSRAEAALQAARLGLTR